MSLFVRPCASRPVLRLAACGLPLRTPLPPSVTLWRWLSSSAAPQSHSAAAGHGLRSATRPRCAIHPASRSYGHQRTFFSPRIIRKYEELPRDYRDQEGIAFKGRDLSSAEIIQVFGPGIDAAPGNDLLRIMHGRRVAGTLADPAFAVHTAQFTDEQIHKALDYLRRTVPVEEVVNAGLRAEDELELMERESTSAKQADAPTGKEATETEDQLPPADPIYGRSAFDRIRARNVAKQKALEAERKAAAEAEKKDVAAGPLATLGEEKPTGITNPRIAKYYEEATSKLEEPEEMSAWQRVLPSATVFVLVMGFLVAVATEYEEPLPKFRLLREISMAHATTAALIAVNCLVWLAWRAPPNWNFLNRWMILTIGAARSVALFTSIFSHQKISHLLINMLPLFFVGSALHEDLGRAQFLLLYLGSGAAGFLGSLAFNSMRGWLAVTSLGASGAVLGTMCAYFWEHRVDRFRLFSLPEEGVHGIVFLALLVAMQLVKVGKSRQLKVDNVSHMSGMIAGVASLELMKRYMAPSPAQAAAAAAAAAAEKEAETKEKKKKTKVIDVWSLDEEEVADEDDSVVAAKPAAPPGQRVLEPKRDG